MGNFLEVQWLGLRASTAGGTVQAKKKKKEKEKGNIEMLKNMNNYPNY